MSAESICPHCGSKRVSTPGGWFCPACETRISEDFRPGVPPPALPPTPPSAADPVPDGGENAAEPVLRRFGEYDLLQELAHGGMGVVYRARQRSLNRIVALKMILGQRLASPADIRRFQTEAQAAARLQHPNIVAIHEVGQVGEDHFYSMDFVAGQSLAQLTRDNPLASRKAAEYVRKVALAIHHAHTQGILHRDLKPSNVMVDWGDEPRVTDFGLAKLMHGDSRQTLSGTIVGTPSYMSPEQAAGHAVDRRSDVYSLGALLYELVTGRPPFRAESTVATLKLVMETDPVPPRRLNPKIPIDLDTICLKCLEKPPARRYPSAEQLALDLARFRDREPISARRLGALAKASRWCQRNPALAGVGTLALLLLLTVAIASPIVAFRLNQARLLAEARELAARRNAYAADLSAVHQALEARNFRHALTLLRNHLPAPGRTEDIRGWEWRYYWMACQGDPATTLSRHDGTVYSVAASPTGAWVVSEDNSGAMRLWSTARNADVLVSSTGGAPLGVFSPDERRYAVPNQSGLVEIHDLPSLARTGTIAHPGSIQWLRFDGPDRIDTWGQDALRSWDAGSGALLRSVPWPSMRRFIATEDWRTWALSDDDRILVRDVDRGILWEARTGNDPTGSQRVELAFSPDRRWIAGSIARLPGGGYTIQLWDATNGTLRSSFPAHSAAINRLAFSPDGAYLASTSNDQTVQVWDTATLRPVATLKGHNAPTLGVAFLPDSHRILSSGGDGSVRLWDFGPTAGSRDAIALHEFIDGDITGETLSPDLSTLVVRQKDKALVIGTQTLGLVRKVEFPFSNVVNVAAGPRSRLLAAGTGDGTIRLWDVQADRVVHRIQGPPDPIRMAFSADGQLLAVKSRDDGFRIWRTADGGELEAWRDRPRQVNTLQFSRDGRLLGCGHRDGLVTLWDVASVRSVLTVRASRSINQLAFSADGRLLAATSQDASARVWKVDTGELVAHFSGGHSSYYSVCFSPDSSRLLVNEWQNAYLFDLGSQRQLAQLPSYRPVFVDADTVLGFSRREVWLWRPPSLSEIDALEAAPPSQGAAGSPSRR